MVIIVNVVAILAVGFATLASMLIFRAYVKNTEIGKALVCNLIAGGLITFAPNNDKAAMAAEAMINSAMTNLVGSLNIEEMVSEFLDGINVDSLTSKGDTDE